MVRLLLLSAVSAFALAGCDDGAVRISSRTTDDAKGVLKVVETLQCPDTLGSLTRKGSASADGLSCDYVGSRGAEVTLHLVRLDGRSADEALDGFERRLAALLPEAAAKVGADKARQQAEAAKADAEAARADAEAARADAQAARADGDHVSVVAPGVRIEAEDRGGAGDRATVRLPGIRIEAEGDNARVQIGGMRIDSRDGQGVRTETTGVSVNANSEATEVRVAAPGEAVRANYILTDGAPQPGGWSVVGYEARGPRGGPLVVATVRAKERGRDRVFDDARDLVTLNVGD
ncbi:methyltransferase type 11 [Brevundimonas sp. VNH65]|uniref:methyltransferase type 11 n=1 Tax=Brevundimonas sp. VNH65 TaxID=3400917 RepID=UPI003C0EED06